MRAKNPMVTLSRKVYEKVDTRNYNSPLPDYILENSYRLYIPMIAIGVFSVLSYFFLPFNMSFILLVVIAIPSVLAHEYGHYTAFSHYGVPSEIYLSIFGGYVKPKRGLGLSSRKMMNITIMGCMVNYIIALFAFLFSAAFTSFGFTSLFRILFAVGMVNIFFGGLNIIIPVGISDGSKLYSIWKKRRKKKNHTGVPPKYRKGR